MRTVSVKIWYLDKPNEVQFFRHLVEAKDNDTKADIERAARNFWHDYKFDIDKPIWKVTIDNY